jgi:excisionase family DNA binding protein
MKPQDSLYGGISLTLAEAARILRVHPDTLRRQVRLGKLKARKIGPIWIVRPQEIERYRRENRRS